MNICYSSFSPEKKIIRDRLEITADTILFGQKLFNNSFRYKEINDPNLLPVIHRA